MSKDKERRFRLVNQSPAPLSAAEKVRLITRATKDLQRIEQDAMGKEVVRVGVDHNEPVIMLNVGDLHVGSLATDLDAIYRLRDAILANPNVMVIFSGDLIEGMTQKYLHTNTARAVLDLEKQFDFVDEILIQPLVEAGRVACAVGEYWGHEGWSQDATTDNPWGRMFNKHGVPVMANGGRVEIEFANGEIVDFQVHHNPPGKSAVEPIYGLRKAALLTDEEQRADVYYSAHIHQMGVGQENFAGALKSVIMVSCGTAKGSSKEVPADRFGRKLGLPLASPINEGAGVVVQPSKRGSRRRVYPFPTGRHGAQVHRAVELLNVAERQKLTEELLQTVRAKVEKAPVVKLHQDKSTETRVPYDESPDDKPSKRQYGSAEQDYAPQYDEVFYNIQTQLPVALHPIAHVRMGSAYEGYEDLRRYQRDLIDGNPHALAVYLRSIIDKEVAGSPDRLAILDRYVQLIKSTGGRTLAFMLCGAMRQGAWKRDVKVGYEQGERGGMKPIYEPPVAPGTYVSEKTGVPMIHHLSRIRLAVGPSPRPDRNTIYDSAYADKLFQHGSFSRPGFGPRRLWDLYLHDKPDIIAGGHMPGSGTMIFHYAGRDGSNYPIEVMPGWWSPYIDTAGKGNVSPGAIPGQAVILMPGSGEKLAYPTANADETRYIHEALILDMGLDILGIRDKVLRKK